VAPSLTRERPLSGTNRAELITPDYSHLRLPQPSGPGPQEQGSPVIPPGSGFPFRRFLLLAATVQALGPACLHFIVSHVVKHGLPVPGRLVAGQRMKTASSFVTAQHCFFNMDVLFKIKEHRSRGCDAHFRPSQSVYAAALHEADMRCSKHGRTNRLPQWAAEIPTELVSSCTDRHYY
jgi:hypothetical protein